ncbi:helix-turn-helix domain-containing protein [Phytohabitans kaempferiae]|uniref:Helix-turn-helix domain-containing protein n=1 Tax=Phytohabitans kaempferiae TaxID=1620943 RepID=A0ABV6M3C2_9ACTN
MSDFQRNRELLGVRLRELRRNARITGVALARQLGWVQSKVSRLECGKQTATREDIEAWVEATEAHPDLVQDLTSLLTNIESDYAVWRREFRSGVRRKQLNFLRLEARVTMIRGLETTVVPGLLQTADYARHRIAEQPDLHNIPEDVSAALTARMQRQQALYDTSKAFHFILMENVLHNRLCPPDVMRGQLDRLTMASGLPNLKLGILPFTARLPVAPLNGFWIFDDALVTFETIAAEIHVRDPDEVALYTSVFDRFDQAAHYGDNARAVIAAAFKTL